MPDSTVTDPVITYVPAAQLVVEQRAALIRDNPKMAGNELIARLDEIERGAVGEYRAVVGHNHEPESEFEAFGEPGDERYVWIDDAPGDINDPSGHFEPYDSDAHGDYHPQPQLRDGQVGQTTIDAQGGAAATPGGRQA